MYDLTQDIKLRLNSIRKIPNLTISWMDVALFACSISPSLLLPHTVKIPPFSVMMSPYLTNDLSARIPLASQTISAVKYHWNSATLSFILTIAQTSSSPLPPWPPWCPERPNWKFRQPSVGSNLPQPDSRGSCPISDLDKGPSSWKVFTLIVIYFLLISHRTNTLTSHYKHI